MNVNDSERIRYILKRRGLNDVQVEDEADIIIINTCAEIGRASCRERV